MERVWSGSARRLSRADRAEIERRLAAGETFTVVGAAVGCTTKSIQRFLALTGGLKSRLKPRSPLRLSVADREELSRGLVAGDSVRRIARPLGGALDNLAGRGLDGTPCLPGVAGGPCGHDTCPAAEGYQARARLLALS